MPRETLLVRARHMLANIILEISATLIQKLGITDLIAEEMFLDQAIASENKLNSKTIEKDNHISIDLEEEDLRLSILEDREYNSSDFILTTVYEVLQIHQGNHVTYALCVKVIDRKTGEPWWLPYNYLKKPSVELKDSH